MKLSTRTMTKLGAPRDLLPVCQSIAMLDAILFPDEWDMRYHSFDPKWGRGEQLFSMRDGSGDFYFLWFGKAGALLQGFGHESAMSPWSTQRRKESGAPKIAEGLFEGRPKSLECKKTVASFCEDPNEVTFCAWRTPTDKTWRTGTAKLPKGKDPDGSEGLLFALDRKPETYAKWAQSYVERTVPLAAIKRIYAREPLTNPLASAINPEGDFEEIRGEARAIEYPLP